SGTAPRAALDTRMIAHSGIGTHLRGLLEGVVQLGRERDVLLLGEREKIEAAGFGAFEVEPFATPISSLAEQLQFPRAALSKRGISLVHSPHYNFPLRAAGLKRLVTVHDIIHLTHAPDLPLHKRLYARH